MGPEGKTLAALDPKELSIALNRNLNQLLEGTFVDERQNILAFGLPGRGKTHYLCAIARRNLRRRTSKYPRLWITRQRQNPLPLCHCSREPSSTNVKISSPLDYQAEAKPITSVPLLE